MEKELLILANGFVLTCDPSDRGGRFDLLIREGEIDEVSETPGALRSLHPDARVVDCTDRLIVPGFVNAHFHSESVLLRAVTKDEHLGLWKHNRTLQDISAAMADHQNQDDLDNVIHAAFCGHLRSGTTCAGEFPPAVGERGFRSLLGAAAGTGVRAIVALQNWEQIRFAKEEGLGGFRGAVNLGREQDFTVYSFENLVRAAGELQVPLLGHVAELREDGEGAKRNFRKDLLAVFRDYGALQPSTILLHLNHATDEDVALAEGTGCPLALSARSAAWKQCGYPLLRRLEGRQLRVCIGTDWANQDVIAEMRFLRELPLLIPGLPSYAPLRLVRMATIEGARALGLGDAIGSVERGKKADLVFFSLASFSALPVAGPPTPEALAELLIDRLSGRDVSDVMIGGAFRLREGKMTAEDEERVRYAFRRTCEKLLPAGMRLPLAVDIGWHDGTQQRPKAVTFVERAKTPAPDLQGFEEGFVAVKKPAEERPDAAGHEDVEAPDRPVRPAAKPELSKNVQRTFGDEDF